MITTQKTIRYLDIEKLNFVKKAMLVIVGTMVLTISAKISIPFWPVETTMQTTALAIIGMLYGSRLGVITVLLYLFEGALGMPVFTGTPLKGIGLAYMVGPTAGFLLGFIFSVYVTGYMIERGYGRSFLSAAGVFAASAVVLYIPGLSWMTYLFSAEMACTNFIMWIPATLAKTGLGIALMLAIKSKVKCR